MNLDDILNSSDK